MEIQQLQTLYAGHPKVSALAKALADDKCKNIYVEGLLASNVPMVFSTLYTQSKVPNALHPFLFILPDADEAGYFYHDLTQIMGEKLVKFFPSSYRRAVKYAQRDPANEILRTEVLTLFNEELKEKESSPFALHSSFIVSYPEAVAEMVVSKKQLNAQTLSLQTGQTIAMDTIEQTLNSFGFNEVDYVYEPGQFALRGSILDVFSYNCEFPYRIDFFGDDVDSIRTFEVENQLSRDQRDHVEIVPEMAYAENKMSLLSFLPADTILVTKDLGYVRDIIERTYQEGFSSQAISERMEEVGERERSEIEQQLRRESQLTTGTQFAEEAERFRKITIAHSRPLHSEDNGVAIPHPSRTRTGSTASSKGKTISFNTSPQPLFHKNFDLLFKTFEDYTLKGYHLYVLADSQKQNERLKEILNEELRMRNAEYPTSSLSRSTHNSSRSTPFPTSGRLPVAFQSSLFTPVDRTLHEGFVDNDLKVCLFTDHQIFDRFHKYNLKSDKARSGKMALTLKEIQQFEVGDFVVHVDHGVGRFGGLVRMPIQTPAPSPRNGSQYSSIAETTDKNNQAEGGFQEMIKITYQRGDAIYVSIHSLYKVSKYKSQDGGSPPRLSTLGTGQWERLKERTKKQIKDIARDLIRLYAARRKQKGFAYSNDNYMQHELEASFLYEDTPDQLKATQDVKADMEHARPMDRLVCGDVGFGKTEVAVRAAFKAAVDGKQTAVLVPTTVLAYQHFRTFSSRLKDMPVRVEYLSRARSAKQTTQILKDLEEGKIDILIGTHKLIGKTVKFHDLGLLIIDEEQKFGVATKEKLRQMKTNVDTLTMSATPIPRTLQFSLVGARDLSVIQTPPPNRYPIQTEIHTFSAEIIADAINFEMSRNGQVYFVNNRISDLTTLEEMIHKYVPDARVAIGHGRMKPDELEQVVLDFSNYDYDVLLSTTIVENGIDIPNANTIIINGAHHFGLSDLHQMRGRVGRSNRKAFCYLLAPPLSALPADARRRMEALENFSDLGSGINIAMQDLDIRGAGNLLGSEQSGFISDLGYETYLKILNEAMAELKSEKPIAKNERLPDRTEAANSSLFTLHSSLYVSDCQLESDLEMYFPDLYVPADSERMLLYRELDNIGNRDDLDTAIKLLDAYRSRLVDRFGKMPQQAEELLNVVPLRILGKQLGCEKILLKQGRMFLYFVSHPDSPYYQSSTFGCIITFATQNVRRCSLREQNGKRSMVVTDVPTVQEAVRVLRDIK